MSEMPPFHGARPAVGAASLDIQLDELGELQWISDGGHSVVHRLAEYSGVLFKRYNSDVVVSPGKLALLIAMLAKMRATDRAIVDDTTAWPLRRVFDGLRCVGFLMAPAPARFAATSGRLQYLLRPEETTREESALLSDDERRELTRHYVALFHTLHRHDIVVGDVSPTNLLWTTRGGVAVFVLGCDGFSIAGRDSAVRLAETTGWQDPATPSGRATLDSDRYRMALLVLRILLGDHRVVPQDVLGDGELRRRLGPLLTGLCERTVVAGMRPSADHWLRALDGRPVVRAAPSVSPVNSPSTVPSTAATPRRPMLRLDHGGS